MSENDKQTLEMIQRNLTELSIVATGEIRGKYFDWARFAKDLSNQAAAINTLLLKAENEARAEKRAESYFGPG